MRRPRIPASKRTRAAFWSLAFVFCALPGTTPAAAQAPLTRADSADVLVGTAERLYAQGSGALAEALVRLVGRRYPDTPAAVRAAALLAVLRSGAESRGGRIGLIAFSTIYGAWLGVAVPIMFEADNSEAYGLGLLAGAPLGFLGGRLYANERSVSAGDAGLVAWSGLWGTWQGGGWMAVLGDSEAECPPEQFCSETGPEASEVVGAMALGGLAGIAASAIVADRIDVSGGTATMIGWGSLWGSSAGLVVSVLAELDGDEILAAALVGGDAGFATAAVLAPRWDMSTGRAWLVNAAGIMGGAIGGGIDLLIQPQDEKVAVLIPAIGSAVGLGLGAWLTRAQDEGRLRESSTGQPDASGALVRLRGDEWHLGVPQPAPILLFTDGRRAAEPGLRVELFEGRF